MKAKIKLKPNRILPICLLMLAFLLMSSCNYYVVKTLEKDEYPTINEMDKAHKYFVIHHKDRIYKMEQISVSSDYLSGKLGEVQREVYYSEYRPKSFKKEERGILREVHIYLKDDKPEIEPGTLMIPLADINEFKVIKKDTGRDIAAYTVAVGAAAALVAILASSGSKNEPKRDPNEEESCNCPYVYVNNGIEYVFEGETLSGALASNLERDDYMPLPHIMPFDDAYSIKITNELKERQFLDVAELVVVDHPIDQKVLLDKTGHPYYVGKAELPVTANSFSGQKLESTLNATDRKVYFFNDEAYSLNGVVLKFRKPKGIEKANLVLNAKNTLWTDHIYSIYASKYGKFYSKWMSNQETIPSDQRMAMILGHDIQLSVYLQQSGLWKLVDYVLPVGLYSPRDLVIPIDLAGMHEEEIKIKVETGFMFWELDFAGIDFTDEVAPTPTAVKASEARDANGLDITSKVSKTDGQYFEQFKTGDKAEFHFDVSRSKRGMKQSIFLHTRGYFETIENFEGKPDRVTLKQFRNPGFFSEFSRAIYLNTLDKDHYASSLYMN